MRTPRDLAIALIPRRMRRSVRLLRQIDEQVGSRVLAGPFAGMNYVAQSHGSVHYPKLLGTYELEVAPVVEKLAGGRFQSIVVAGAAEGYYAVGFARRNPESTITAFEASSTARGALRELAILNGVLERIDIRALCDAGGLAQVLAEHERSLLIMDLDGGEAALLDPSVVPLLARTEILVEVHDCFVEGVSAAIESRFSATHEIERHRQRRRSRKDCSLTDIPAAYEGALMQLLDEKRPRANDWLYLHVGRTPDARVEASSPQAG